MQAIEILDTVSAAGGVVWLDGDKVRARLPENLAALVDVIRELKPQLIELLAQRPAGWFVNGKRVTVFPHCPKCSSYALYRENNIGDYECQTCGLTGIEESTARRVN